MGRRDEYACILAVLGTLGAVGVSQAQRTAGWALVACDRAYRTDSLEVAAPGRRGYGWGHERHEIIRCPATSQGRPQHRLAIEPHDDRGARVGCAVVHGLLAAGAARSLRRRRRELVASLGRDESPGHEGGYRQPAAVRRVLPPGVARAWRREQAWPLAVWTVSTATVAWLGSGRMPVPMPWALAAWSLVTLPSAVTCARWRGEASWGAWIPAIAAVGVALGGGAWAAAVGVALSAVCLAAAASDERRRRRSGRW